MTFADLLLDHFLNWQRSEGERRTLKEFAEHLGISDKLLNHYMTGRRLPSEDSVAKIYSALGDERVYQLLGKERPDYRLVFIREHWGQMPEDEKVRVMEMFSKYVPRRKSRNEPKTQPKPTY